MKRLLALVFLSSALISHCGRTQNNNSGTANNSGLSSAQATPAAQKDAAKLQQTTAHELFKKQADKKLLYDPQKHDYLQVRDVRKQVADLSKRFAPSQKERQLFIQRSNELENQRKRRLSTADKVAPANTPTPPLPGGVGVGVYFRDTELLFSQSSSIYHYIIASPSLGGNTADFFYLTSTNRAGRGCEAFVSYSRQDKPLFRVFDWAKESEHQDPWVVSIPYDNWGAYKLAYSIDGHDYEAVYVVNATYAIDDTTWANEVYLHNGQTGTRDLIWSYTFKWMPADQGEKNAHWWGPILETFAPDYGETNTVGFAEGLLVQDGFERILVDANSYTSNDGSDHGFQLLHLDRNYTFLAR